jgi:hypothetical protein
LLLLQNLTGGYRALRKVPVSPGRKLRAHEPDPSDEPMKAAKSEQSRTAEAMRVIEEYAGDLRETIGKLRKLN